MKNENFELPDRDGAVIGLEPTGAPHYRTTANRKNGHWYISGWVVGETRLRQEYDNFEVLNDGSES